MPSGPPYPSAFLVDEVTAFLQDEVSRGGGVQLLHLQHAELGAGSLGRRYPRPREPLWEVQVQRPARADLRQEGVRPVEGRELPPSTAASESDVSATGCCGSSLQSCPGERVGMAGPDCRVLLRRQAQRRQPSSSPFKCTRKLLGVADNFGQNDFEGPSHVLVVKRQRALCRVGGQWQ